MKHKTKLQTTIETTIFGKPFLEDVPFATFDEIEDVRIIVKAKGKHYAIVARENKDEAKDLRIAAFGFLLNSHFVIDTPLEELQQLS